MCCLNAVAAHCELGPTDIAALRSHHPAAVDEAGRYHTLKAASGTFCCRKWLMVCATVLALCLLV